MKRVWGAVTVLASVLAVVPSAAAAPATDAGHAEWFRSLDWPDNLDLGSIRAAGDMARPVPATVILTTDSVAAARHRAARTGSRFDRAAAERAAAAAQQALRPALVARGATVTGSVKVVLDAVTVRATVADLASIARLPGVARVHASRPARAFNGTSDEYTGVTAAWQATGLTGTGIKIAVMDDGIDYYHAAFGGSGDPADVAADDGLDLSDGHFPTAKVAGGWDFVGDAYDPATPGADVPVPDPDPLPCGDHGTHVAATAAGNGVLADGTTYSGPYDAATIASHRFLVAPGAAPGATLYAYRVFGCAGLVGEDVQLQAIERAVLDDVDVLNMSLGYAWGSADDPVALALDAAAQEGVLAVVAAGNSGPNGSLVSGPSTADSALSVAAVDAGATVPVVAVGGGATLSGQNSNLFDFSTTGPISGELVPVGPGCDAADYAAVAGKIAVSVRGACDRVAKAKLGAAAGAVAVLMVNNGPGLPPIEGPIPGVAVPFVGVDGADGPALVAGLVATLADGGTRPNPAFQQYASFTSNGPRGDGAAKPDVSAPGVAVLSADAGTGTQGTLESGTSMATPHTAGIAALVRQAHPTWDPLAVKAAIMSTADPTKVSGFDVVRGGTGVVSADAAVATSTYLATPDGRQNLSFGFRQLGGPSVLSRSIDLVNTSSSPITYDITTPLDVSEVPGAGVTAAPTPSTITVPANARRTVTVKLSVAAPERLPGVEAGLDGAMATVGGLLVATPRAAGPGVGVLRAPIVFVPSGLSAVQTLGSRSAGGSGSAYVDRIRLSNVGTHAGSAVVLQWAITDPADSPAASVPDIRDVGVMPSGVGGGRAVVFDISTFGRLAAPAAHEFDIAIDVDGDAEEDYWLVGIDEGVLGGAPNGRLVSALFDADFEPVDLLPAIAPANGSNVLLPLNLEAIGDVTRFGFQVSSWSGTEDRPSDDTSWAVYDATAPAVTSGFTYDMPTRATVVTQVTVDPVAQADQRALGWLVVSFDDAAGAREADRVPIAIRRMLGKFAWTT